MTEAEWNTGIDPTSLLAYLRLTKWARKLRLFACACVRRLSSENSEIVDLSERFADGKATSKELRDMRSQIGGRGGYSSAWAFSNAIGAIVNASAWPAAEAAAEFTALYFHYLSCERKEADRAQERTAAERGTQTSILRDIFGNPFRPAAVDPAWRRWNDGAAVAIARKIYDDRDFTSMPVLADALEEAGCTNADILEDCRRPAEHVRGCWVVDLVLGKE